MTKNELLELRAHLIETQDKLIRELEFRNLELEQTVNSLRRSLEDARADLLFLNSNSHRTEIQELN